MTKTKHKILSVFLSLCMVVSCMAGMSLTAGAAADGLWINNVQVTASNSSGTGWSYNASTNTLTLSNYTFDGVGAAPPTDSTVIMYYPQSGTFNIVLEGTNTIKQGYGNSKTSWGIYCRTDFTIGGTGTLNISTKDGAKRGAAIYSEKNLTIKDTCTVNATSGTVTGDAQGYGIGTGTGTTLTIGENAKVTLTGPKGGTNFTVKNAEIGTGWTDTAGTAGKTSIAASTTGQNLISYKKVYFPAEAVATVTASSTTTKYSDFAAAVTAWNSAANGSTLKLLKDVTTASTVTVSGTKILDLNGYGIRMTGNSRVMAVGNGANLTLNDSDKTHAHAVTLSDYRGTAVADGTGTDSVTNGTGTAYITGGYITGGNETNDGGGIQVTGNGVFTMNAGTIIGNISKTNCGGALQGNNSSGKNTINGGSFIYNKAKVGGGLNGWKLNFVGTSPIIIKYNMATDEAGGARGDLYFSGDVTVTDNICAKGPNVYLYNGASIYVTGTQTNTTPIGVTVQNGTGVFTKSTSTTNNNAEKFASDNESYAVIKNGSGQLELVKAVTVTFDTNGGTPAEIEAQKIAPGGKATQPDDPAKDGYDFGGWYNGDTKFDFNTAVTGNITLKAKWTKNVEISSVEEWNAFVAKVNGGDTFAGRTVKLTADLEGVTEKIAVDKQFLGTFDGQGHIMIVNFQYPTNVRGAALFPYFNTNNASITVKNLTLGGVISGGQHTAGIIGEVTTNINTTINIENVNVVAFMTQSNTHLGGFIGHAGNRSTIKIKNCHFLGDISRSSGIATAIGGIVGWRENSTTTNISDASFGGTIKSGATNFNPWIINFQNENDSYFTAEGTFKTNTSPSGNATTNCRPTAGACSTIEHDVKSEFIYDGEPHSLEITVTAPANGAIITYGTEEGKYLSLKSPTVTELGETKTVYYQIAYPNYTTVRGKAELSVIELHEHDDIRFSAWTSKTALPTAAGSYYLVNDVTISSTWNVPSGTTNLCLNGHSIRRTGNGSAIYLDGNDTLNIYDCGTTEQYYKINSSTHRGEIVNSASDADGSFTGGYITAANGRGIETPAKENLKAYVNMYGGTVFACQSGCGSGIYSFGHFHMYDGAFIGNYNSGQSNTWGGTVYNAGELVIEGGLIRHNYGFRGSGVFQEMWKNSTGTIKGGTIKDNTSTNAGGGVYLNHNGPTNPKFIISGNLEISGNKVGNADNNVYIPKNDYKYVYVDGKLSNTTPIGITMDSPAVFTNSTDTSFNDVSKFKSDNASYVVGKNAAGQLLLGAPVTVTIDADNGSETTAQTIASGSVIEKPDDPTKDNHDFIGWYNGDTKFDFATAITKDITLKAKWESRHKHDGIAFEPWTSTTSLPTAAGSYFLTDDVTISGTWTVPAGTTNLCLNGHGIKKTGNGSVINVSSGRTLNLYDCDTTTTHNYSIASPKANGAGLATVGTGDKSFTGGYITGGNATSNYGGGVLVNGGTFIMNGGTFIGNKVSGANGSTHGGGVSVKNSGKFTMNGGSVIGNWARCGGGISVVDGSSCTINGGEIRFNSSSRNGGGLHTDTNVKIIISGGAVTNNYTDGGAYANGGVLIASATLDLSGDPIISDNLTGKNPDNLHIYQGIKINISKTLSNSEAIGITLTKTNYGVFTGSETTDYNVAAKFKSDNENYTVIKNADGQLELVPVYTVTFDTDGGTPAEIEAQKVTSGKTAVQPDDPTKADYAFAGWYNGDTKFDFATAITKDITLKAKWESAHKHDGIDFSAWTGATALPTAAGNYFLTQDVTLSSTWNVPSGTTNLCLNGHGIRMAGNDSVITALNGVNLTIYDCEPDHVDDSSDRPTDPTTGAKVKGGFITGGKGKKVSSSGQMKGGGIFIDRGTVTMKGGTVIDCKIDTNVNNNHGGGGVYIGGTFNMYEGAAIVGCSIKCPNGHAWGGAVCVDSVFNMYGGRIENNLIVAKEVTGGGVWGRDYNLLTGSSVIINNTANGVSSNYQISGNNANCPSINNLTDDADLYIYTLTMPTDTSDVRFAKNSDKDAIKHITSDRSTSAGILYCDGTNDWIYYNGEFYKLTGHHTHSSGTLWLSTAAKFCTVTFDNDGGIPVPEEQTVLRGNKAKEPFKPVKENYVFKGWYNGTAKFDFNTPIEESITLKAKWQIAELNVSFDSDGGSAVEAQTVNYGKKATAPAVPTKPGYAFKEWQLDGAAYDFDSAVTEDIELKAVWEIVQYTISFDTDGGSEINDITQDYGTKVTVPADPTKTGYTFAGWNKEIPLTMPAEDTAIKALWNVNTHTLTYKVDGAVYGDIETVDYGTALKARTAPTRKGYTFSGWSEIPASMPDNDVVITGTFTVNTYKVTFNTNGGTITSGAVKEYTYGKGTSLPTEVEKPGFNFAGWYTSSSLSGTAVNNIGSDETGDKVFYAAWEPIDVTIFFNTNGGTTIEPITQAFDTVFNSPSDPVREGYTFAGWDKELPEKMPASNMTVTANWKINSYTISFDTRGGTAINDITADYGAAVKAPADPTREGYTFSGWDTAIPSSMPAENLALTAVWTVNNYTLTFDTQGGTAVAPITQAYGTAVTAPDAPTKTGFTFAGWDKEIPGTVPAQDMSFKALWKINSHTLTYRVDGAVYGDVENVDYGTALTLRAAPTKTGYTFSGWSELPAVMPDNDVVVTGSFTVNTYKVTLNTNGGSLPSGAVTKYTYGTGVSLPTGLTRTGYVFGGWYDNAGFTGSAVNNISDTDIGDKVFYAKWNVNQYTIFFDTDGGTTVEPITQDYNTAVKAPADPTKTGHTFSGWDKAIPETMPAKNTTIKAKWTVDQYTISFDTDGGSAIAPKKQAYGTKVTAPADPTKTGYTFSGWDTAIPETMPAENMTIKAKWTVNQYTISFDTDGGSTAAAIKQDYGTKITVPADPTKTGYTFAGWDKEIPLTMPAGDMSVKALWKINSHTLTYKVDGAVYGAIENVPFGTELTTRTAPTRKGYTFSGWSEIPASMPDNDVVITGMFTVNTYKVTFNTNGGTITSGTISEYTYGKGASLPTALKKKGNNFAGWYTNSSLTGTAVNNIGSDETGDKVFYAKWEVNKYTIFFDTNGGTSIDPITQDFDTDITAPSAPTRTGYTFGAWDKEIPAKMPAENMTVKVKWTVNSYTISFDTQGGSAIAPKKQAYGTKVTAPADPTKTGYTFSGWDKSIPSSMPAENLVLTAVWTVNNYTLTFDTQGGTAVAPITQAYGTAVTAPDAPTKTGFTFMGWDKDIPGTVPAQNMSFKALWEVNSHTLTYRVNGAVYGDVENVDYGTALTLRAAPTKTGYTFSGWSELPAVMPDNDVVVTGSFTVNTYKVTLNTNGGTLASGAVTKYTYGEGASLPTELTKTGCLFGGWYDNSALSGSAVNNISETDIGDKVFYAKWNINQYTIFFDTDGGTTVEPITQDYNTAVTAPADPTKTGHTFSGWDKPIPAKMPAENTNIKAKWTVEQYTISFDTDGGSAIAPIKQEYGTKVTAPADPTKTGHTFSGWDTAIPETMPAENMTVKAIWTVNRYTITFVTGGSNIAPITQDYGTAVTKPADPVKSGYTFIGWNMEIPTVMPAQDLTVTARWTDNVQYIPSSPVYDTTVVPSTPDSTPQTHQITTVDISRYSIKGEQGEQNESKLRWEAVPDAVSYSLYIKAGGKYTFVQNLGKSKAVDVVLSAGGKYYVSTGKDYNIYKYDSKTGKFTKTGTLKASRIGNVIKANNVTIDYMIKYIVNGKSSADDNSYKISVKIYYKPALNLTTSKGSITIKWDKVPGAVKYRVYKYVNGKLKLFTETKRRTVLINGTKAGKKYSYAVKAYIDGKWTKVYPSDIATITSK